MGEYKIRKQMLLVFASFLFCIYASDYFAFKSNLIGYLYILIMDMRT